MLIARAPIGISFGGGGTDLEAYYANYSGLVISTAINKFFYAVLTTDDVEELQVISADYRPMFLHSGMYLLGCTYNFCWPYHELSRSAPDAETGKPSWVACTPAMASGLTDHVWSVCELMSYWIAPPAWIAPKRRGRPRSRPLPDPMAPKCPRGRPRKLAVITSTSQWSSSLQREDSGRI
jgi:hypothetical protein